MYTHKGFLTGILGRGLEFYMRRMTPSYVRRSIRSFRKKIATEVGKKAPVAAWNTSAPYDITQVKLARHKILKYLDVQLDRAHKWANSDIDMLAWSARNIMEAGLWLEFLAENPKNITLFIREECRDHHELVKLMLLCLDEYEPSSNAGKALSVINGIKLFKPLGFRDKIIANKTLTLQFKLCSKLLHPTALSISGLSEQSTPQLRSQILVQIIGELERLSASLEMLSDCT
jgi:hypothetical protein